MRKYCYSAAIQRERRKVLLLWGFGYWVERSRVGFSCAKEEPFFLLGESTSRVWESSFGGRRSSSITSIIAADKESLGSSSPRRVWSSKGPVWTDWRPDACAAARSSWSPIVSICYFWLLYLCFRSDRSLASCSGERLALEKVRLFIFCLHAWLNTVVTRS